MKKFGLHYLVEYVGCEPSSIGLVERLEPVFLEAARISQATILSSSFKQFQPQGVSGYIFIAESHFSIHTWPEESYAAVDIFTCGETMDANKALDYLSEQFGASKMIIKEFERGVP